METVAISLSKKELEHIINDMLAYIDNLGERIAPHKYVYGRLSDENNKPTEEEIQSLETCGFFTRRELLRKLKKLQEVYFPEYECKG